MGSEGINPIASAQEKSRDPFLEELWSGYGFPGRPPFEGGTAETRLKEACNKYAIFIDEDGTKSPKDRSLHERKISDSERRKLHNEIALMVVSEQRSGMLNSMAEHIGEFAYEYARGYKIAEADKYK